MRDLYGECNTQGAPVDAFTAECCAFCLNPECTRSFAGKSKFDIRTNTWRERLFSNIPRMDPNDPQYERISAQKFLAINPSLAVDSRPSWVDPKDLQEPKEAPYLIESPLTVETKRTPKSEVFPEPAKPIAKFTSKPTPEPVPEPPKTLPSEPQPVQKGRLSNNLAFVNTPAQQGQMIPSGGPPKTDSWDAPVPSGDTTNIRVVKPGEKIKLG